MVNLPSKTDPTFQWYVEEIGNQVRMIVGNACLFREGVDPPPFGGVVEGLVMVEGGHVYRYTPILYVKDILAMRPHAIYYTYKMKSYVWDVINGAKESPPLETILNNPTRPLN